MMPAEVNAFLSSLPLRDATHTPRNAIALSPNFPLMVQKEALDLTLKGWLPRLSPYAASMLVKEFHPLLMTSAPTGSGKTVFLSLLCQLFEYKWDVDAFADQLVSVSDSNPSTSEALYLWRDYVRESLSEVKENSDIKNLIASGPLSQCFLDSTHSCFITFNSFTYISSIEIELLGRSPMHMVIARMIYAEFRADALETMSYSEFLFEYARSVLRINHIRDVSLCIRRRFNCTHYLLAVDELMFLDKLPRCDSRADGAKSSGRYAPQISAVLTALSSMVVENPWFSTIISSLVTGPLQEYEQGSQHTPHFIPLRPYFDRFDELTALIASQRHKNEDCKKPILRMLLSSGGHPRLLSFIVPWMCDADLAMSDMTLAKAAAACCLNNQAAKDAEVVDAILAGCEVSADVAARAAGYAGMLTRPTLVDEPTFLIASPLLLFSVAVRRIGTAPLQELRINLEHLVPSQIVAGGDFERFIATWLSLRLHMGASLSSVLAGSGGDAALCESLHIRATQYVNEFVDANAFQAALSKVKSKKIKLECTERNSAPWNPDLFLTRDTASSFRVSLPLHQGNRGFDILVGEQGEGKRGQKRSVLLIQCKTTELHTIENERPGQTFSAIKFADTIRMSASNASNFFNSDWDVSLLVVAACTVTENAVYGCTISSRESANVKALHQRSGIIAGGKLRDILGPSFALAFELAQGHTYCLPYASSTTESSVATSSNKRRAPESVATSAKKRKKN